MNPLLQFSGPGSMTFLHRRVNLSFLLPVSELPAYRAAFALLVT